MIAWSCGHRCIMPTIGDWGVWQPDGTCSKHNLDPDCHVCKYLSIITSIIKYYSSFSLSCCKVQNNYIRFIDVVECCIAKQVPHHCLDKCKDGGLRKIGTTNETFDQPLTRMQSSCYRWLLKIDKCKKGNYFLIHYLK